MNPELGSEMAVESKSTVSIGFSNSLLAAYASLSPLSLSRAIRY